MKIIITGLALILFLLSCDNKNSKTEVVENNLEEVKSPDSVPTPPPPPSKNEGAAVTPEDLQGKWQSMDDAKNRVEIKGDKKMEYYDNEKVSEETFIIKNDTLETTDMTSGDKMQYLVSEVSKENISLIYLARGNSLKYKKIK